MSEKQTAAEFLNNSVEFWNRTCENKRYRETTFIGWNEKVIELSCLLSKHGKPKKINNKSAFPEAESRYTVFPHIVCAETVTKFDFKF